MTVNNTDWLNYPFGFITLVSQFKQFNYGPLAPSSGKHNERWKIIWYFSNKVSCYYWQNIEENKPWYSIDSNEYCHWTCSLSYEQNFKGTKQWVLKYLTY